MGIDIFELYKRVLVPMTPSPAVTKLLQLIMNGAETTDDITRLVATDQEIAHWIRLTTLRLGLGRRAQKVDHMVTLLGVNRVRDVIIGRQLERAFFKEENTLLHEAREAARKEKESADKNKKPAKKGEETPPPEKELSDEEKEALEIIPNINDFSRYLAFAQKAEETAISIRNSYPGQAFAGGVIFDNLRWFLKNVVKTDDLKDKRVKNIDALMEHIFNDGLRSGIVAHEIVQKISIPHQKNVFVISLVHNVGKGVLLAYDAPAFERSFLASTGAEKKEEAVESTDAEEREFEMDHAQAGAMLVGRLPFLAEIDRSVDSHHNPHLLRFSNPGLYALACILVVSNRLVKLYQKARQENPDIENLRDPGIQRMPEFQFLKLDEKDWNDIKSNYALNLMKAGL